MAPPLDSDVAALLAGDVADLTNSLQALKAHVHNHRLEMHPELAAALAQGVDNVEVALTYIQCCRCEQLAVNHRGDGFDGDFYCAAHDGLWQTCDGCRADVLERDMEACGSLQLCRACTDGPDDDPEWFGGGYAENH